MSLIAGLSYLVLSFVGSTGSTTISFILPGLFFWKVSSLGHLHPLYEADCPQFS